MRFNPGDMVFSRNGRPSVVTGRKETGHIILERKGENMERVRNFGVVNGLTPTQRKEYEDVVNKVRQEPFPEKRIEALQSKVDEMGMDPKKWVVKRYLNAELSHLMNSERIYPNTFTVEDDFTQ